MNQKKLILVHKLHFQNLILQSSSDKFSYY